MEVYAEGYRLVQSYFTQMATNRRIHGGHLYRILIGVVSSNLKRKNNGLRGDGSCR